MTTKKRKPCEPRKGGLKVVGDKTDKSASSGNNTVKKGDANASA